MRAVEFIMVNPFWLAVAAMQAAAGVWGLWRSGGRLGSVAMAAMMMLYSVTSVLMVVIEWAGRK